MILLDTLRLNDYVNVKGKNAVVVVLTSTYAVVNRGFGEEAVIPRDLNGVPLTFRLLKINGFKAVHAPVMNLFTTITMWHKDSLTIISYPHGDFAVQVGNRLVRVNYVHELQHILAMLDYGMIINVE